MALRWLYDRAPSFPSAMLLIALGAAIGAFIVASGPAPEPRVEYREKLVEKIVEVRVKDEAKVETRTVYRTRTIKPDGSRTTVERIDSGTKTETHEAEAKQAERVVEVERRVDVRPPLPKWKVGAVGGLDVPARAWVYGGTVERRLFDSPIWGGVWATNRGAVGVTLSVEF